MSQARIIIPTVASLACAATLASPAAASSVDYGALEELFNEKVTASATGAPQRVTEAPVNMTIIGQEEIRRSGAIDLPGVLERLASIDVNRSFSGQADVSIRGYNQALSPRLLVLVNGRQVYLDHYGMTNWDLVPVQLSEIRQIEVVRGPNSALFGFNAAAGVINIVTFDPLKDGVRTIEATVGDSQYGRISGVFTGKIGERIGVRASLGGFDSDASDGDRARVATAQDPLRRTGQISAGIDITPKLRADLEASWGLNERTETLPYGADGSPQYEANSFRAALSADTSVGMIEGQVYTNALDTAYPLVIGGVLLGQAVLDNRITVGSVALVARPLPAHIVRVAGELRHNTYEQAPAGRGELSYNVYAVSGMWNWRASDSLTLTAALRADTLQLERTGAADAPLFPLSNAAYDQDFTELSANLGAVWRATSNDAVRLTYARGVQSPSLVSYGIQLAVPSATNTVILSGNPDLSPTIVTNVELGWDRDINQIGGRLRASIFWQKNEDLAQMNARIQPITMLPSGPLLAAFSQNIGDSEAIGAEVALEGKLGPVNWDLGYAYRSLDDALTTSPILVPVAFEDTTPAHIATAGLIYATDRFELGADTRFVSEQDGFRGSAPPYQRVSIDSYWLVNGRVAAHLTEQVTLALSLRNAFDEDTPTTSRAPVDRRAYLSLTADF